MNRTLMPACVAFGFVFGPRCTSMEAVVPPSDKVEQTEATFNDENGKVLWRAILKSFRMGLFNSRALPPVVSQDFSRFAYGLCDGEMYPRRVIIDGKAEPEYSEVGPIVFSPDSGKIAYVASQGQLGKGGGKLLVNGAVVGSHKDQVYSILFSPDSRHMAYVADGSVFLDGIKLGTYLVDTENMSFSPDSQHLSYSTNERDQAVVYQDGKKLKSAEAIATFSVKFSPDSKTLTYTYRDKGAWFVAFGDASLGPYEEVQPIFLAISPDSRRIAFPARIGNEWFLVTPDGRLGPYPNRPSILFSPDSKRMMHAVAVDKERVNVFLDRQSLGTFDRVYYEAFTPDSLRLVFISVKEEAWSLFIDGKRIEDNMIDYAFNPMDSSLAVILPSKEGPRVSFGGKQGKPYARIMKLFFSPDGRQLVYWAIQGRETILVVDGRETVRFAGSVDPRIYFSPDGRIRGNAFHCIEPDAAEAAREFTIDSFKKQLARSRFVLFELLPASK